MQRWICRPLCVQQRILDRQQAIEELYYNDVLRQATRALLKKLPDLERQVTKYKTNNMQELEFFNILFLEYTPLETDFVHYIIQIVELYSMKLKLIQNAKYWIC